MQGRLRQSHSAEDLRVSDDALQLNGLDTSFVNDATYFDATFYRGMTWRYLIKSTTAKALRMYVRTYSLLKSRRLSANIKLRLYKTLIVSVITYACPIWECAADAHLLKLQRLQNRVLGTI
jgi:hypothetical protein